MTVAMPKRPNSTLRCGRCGLVVGPVQTERVSAGPDGMRSIRPQIEEGNGLCRALTSAHRWKVVS